MSGGRTRRWYGTRRTPPATIAIVLAAAVGPAAGLEAASAPPLDASVVDEFTAEVDGDVIDVSRHGDVLVDRNADGERVTCVYTLEGTEKTCWHLDVAPGFATAIDWSPNGRLVAFDNAVSSPGLEEGAVIQILDITTGDVRSIGGAGDVDPARPDRFQILPVWRTDDELWYVRGPFGGDSFADELELVRATLDGDETTQPLGVTLGDLGPQEGALIGDRYMLSVHDGTNTEILGFAEGEPPAVVSRVDTTLSNVVGWIDDRGVVVSFDDDYVAPTAVFWRDRFWTIDEFAATAGVVDPSGDLVAGAVPDLSTSPPDRHGDLMVWEPESGALDDVGELDAPVAMTWTHDGEIVVWSVHSWQVFEVRRMGDR